MKSFNYYIVAKGITDVLQKQALLLHMAGSEVQDIFETISNPEAIVLQEGEDKFSATVRILNNHFIPQTNITYERHLFRQLRQTDDETVDQFVSRLRRQAGNCGFTDVDEQIKDQLLDKCKSTLFRRKLLEKGSDVTLQIALDIGRSLQMVDEQIKKMEGMRIQHQKIDADGDANVNFVKQNNRNRRLLNVSPLSRCYRCNKTGHMARDPSCPAKQAMCQKCGKMGHFKVVCHTKKTQNQMTSFKNNKHVCVLDQENNLVSSTKRNTDNNGNKNNDTNQKEYVFSVTTASCEGLVELHIGGVKLEMLIDSGASCNVIDKDTWAYLKSEKFKCLSHQKEEVNLFAYGSNQPMKVLGTFVAEARLGHRQITAKFVVINGKGKSLLGKKSAEELNVLQVGRVDDNRNDIFQDDIFQEYQDCFKGIGKLKNYQVKLHVDENIQPVAQSVRRIPFSLRKAVEDELKRLLDMDIIEKVEGPTPWVSPIIIVPKKRTNEIRLCVDMRMCNRAVIRERHPIPTIDEILYQLNEGVIFSKLDLKGAFHQLELSEDSRPITTFITHVGLFRYKRLMFGISSAPEVCQHVIQQVISGCRGAYNISDDIVVHGRNLEEHDKRLRAVLNCIRKNGLTLNREKSQIRLTKLTFFGHVLSGNGIGPDKDKVKAIIETREPKCASEIRSFLGLVQFVSRYIPNLSTISEPLRRLTRSNVRFYFGSEQRQAFHELKKKLSSVETLAYFRPGARTQVIADASTVGLGGVLVQSQDGISRIVCYASRQLTDVEKRYSTIEREALALVWAVERFNLFLFGSEFELCTDHKPLEYIFKPRSKPSARIERWVLRLQSYSFKVIHIPGQQNIADTLSRLVLTKPEEGDNCDHYIKFIASMSTPNAISTREIERETAKDPEMIELYEQIQSGHWTNTNQWNIGQCEMNYVLLVG